MKFTLKQGKIAKHAKSCQIIGVTEKGQLSIASKMLDKAHHTMVNKLLKQGDFKGSNGQTWLIPLNNSNAILLVGCGSSLTVSAGDFRKIISSSVKLTQGTHLEQIVVALNDLTVTDYDAGFKI